MMDLSENDNELSKSTMGSNKQFLDSLKDNESPKSTGDSNEQFLDSLKDYESKRKKEVKKLLFLLPVPILLIGAIFFANSKLPDADLESVSEELDPTSFVKPPKSEINLVVPGETKSSAGSKLSNISKEKKSHDYSYLDSLNFGYVRSVSLEPKSKRPKFPKKNETTDTTKYENLQPFTRKSIDGIFRDYKTRSGFQTVSANYSNKDHFDSDYAPKETTNKILRKEIDSLKVILRNTADVNKKLTTELKAFEQEIKYSNKSIFSFSVKENHKINILDFIFSIGKIRSDNVIENFVIKNGIGKVVFKRDSVIIGKNVNVYINDSTKTNFNFSITPISIEKHLFSKGQVGFSSTGLIPRQ